jgi:uncharacterized membrane protein YidH (DUF202 family)
MRFLIACGVAILIAATAKTTDVGLTPFGSAVDDRFGLPFALWNFVLYGLGVALIFSALAAHIGLAGARPQGWQRTALVLTPIGCGLALVAFVPWTVREGLARITPEEQARYVVVVTVAHLHLVADGVLLATLGLRLARPPVAA